MLSRRASRAAIPSLGRGVVVPLGLVCLEFRGPILPIGRPDAFNTLIFDLCSDDNGTAADTLGIGVNLFFREAKIG
jgi:hypothetical protein